VFVFAGNSLVANSKNPMKTLKEIASQFLLASLPVEKLKLRLEAQVALESININQSKTALFEAIGVGYFGKVNSSQKMEKGSLQGFDSLGIYLSPAGKSGKDLCTFACNGCIAACLDESGHNLLEKRSGKQTIDIARVLRSWTLEFRKDIAYKILRSEIESAERKAKRNGRKFCVRLNCTSDVNFSDLIASFPDVQFYDYTKNPNNTGATNHHITFSWGGFSKGRLQHYKDALKRGMKIAFPIVKGDFEKVLELPNTQSFDQTDLRFLDGPEQFGILAVKETGNTEKGIKEGFFLTYEAFQEAIDWIEG